MALIFGRLGLRRGVEIGVADGRFSLVLCESIPNIELSCVDPWMPYGGNPRGGPREQHEGNFIVAQQRLKSYGARFIRGMSLEGAVKFEDGSLDFVYIDGNHGYEYVLADLKAWAPKVRPGGIVAGHDFYEFKWAGVIEAVEHYTAKHGITDWALTSEREPSFWWTKRD